MKRAIDERPRLAIATAAAALVLVVATIPVTSSLSGAVFRAMRVQPRAPAPTATVHRLGGQLASAQTAVAAATQRAKETRQLADAHLARASAWKARAQRAKR